MMWFSKSTKKVNPFDVKPNPNLIGLDAEKKKLISYIEGGGICFLTGIGGIGKTSLLKWLQLNIKKHTLAYINLKKVNEFFDFDKYIKKHGNIFRRILGLYPKNLVILVDEAQEVEEKLINALETCWGENLTKSVVVTQICPSLDNFPDSFKERIGDRIIRMKTLTYDEVHELIKLRTAGKHPFDEEAIDLIAEKSGFIPRKILEKCEVLCTELDKESISVSDVEYLFNKKAAEEIEQGPGDFNFLKDLKSSKVKEDVLVSMEKVDGVRGVSPMQKRIIKLLLEGSKTTKQLAGIISTSSGSVSKQLSELSKAEVVCVSSKRRPKTFALTNKFKEALQD